MASIHKKTKGGTWYVSYRERGKLKHRSLGTTSERKAHELQREIELLLEERGVAEVVISDRPKPEMKDPPVEEFWQNVNEWLQTHRTSSTANLCANRLAIGEWLRDLLVQKVVADRTDLSQYVGMSRTRVGQFLSRAWLPVETNAKLRACEQIEGERPP
jgi:hypothetical protein